MESKQQQAWEQFCQTGAISDYLAYRVATASVQEGPQGREETHADCHRRPGGAGKTAGGA